MRIMLHGSTIPAAVTRNGNDFQQLLPWLVVLLLTVIVGGLIIYLARRLAHRSGQQPNTGFTLQDLRELHAQGELTDEQFERARTQMLARVRGAADNTDSADEDQQADRQSSTTSPSDDASENQRPAGSDQT